MIRKSCQKWQLFAVALLLLLGVTLGQIPVFATGIVGMSSPDDVNRGSAFKIQVTCTGAEAGVEALQLYLQYDGRCFQFVKPNSLLLETPGSQISEGPEVKARTLNDNGSVITMLAFNTPGNTGSTLVAELEFICKVDAPIAPSSFQFIDTSFVSVIGVGKVAATVDKLTLAVVDANVAAGEQGQAYPPEVQPLPVYTADPNIGAADPENLVQPVAPLPSDPNALGVDRGNAQTAAPQSPSRPAGPMVTARPDDTPSQPSTAASTQSPLLSVLGEALYVPETGLSVEAIPAGFHGETALIKGVNINIARSAERNLSLYWLRSTASPAFYSYDAASDRFKLFDLAALQSQTTASQTAREFKTGDAGSVSTGRKVAIALVSILGLFSLSVLIYSLGKNLRR